MERAERMMIRWMCKVTLKDRIHTDELRQRLGVDSVVEVVRQGRHGWTVCWRILEKRVEERACTKSFNLEC